MIILHKLFEFEFPDCEMVNIYILFIRSFLEQSSVVWHNDITDKEISDIEIVQMVACKVILGQSYTDYPIALNFLSQKPEDKNFASAL